jgi:hypothetical protein
MLITLLALVATFFVVRFLMHRYPGYQAISTIVASVVVAAFVAGFAEHALLFGSAVPAGPAPAPAATATPSTGATPMLPGAAVRPTKHELDRSSVTALAQTGKAISYSVVENFAGAGISGDQVAAGSTILIHGWAGDPITKSAGHGLLLILDGTRHIDESKSYGELRMDVATAFNFRGMLYSGFDISLRTAGLAKGPHYLQVAVIRPDDRHFVIVLTPPRLFNIN